VYSLSRPNPALAPYIDNYWHVVATPERPFDLSVDVYVDLRADLVFNFGVGYERTEVGRQAQQITHSNLDAQRLVPIRIVQRGHVRVAGVRFHVGGLMPFVRHSLDAFTGRVVSIAEALGSDGVALDSELRRLDGETAAQAAALDAFFLARLQPHPDHAHMRTLLDAVNGSDGSVRVESLGDHADLAPRTVGRLFKRYLGVAPKTYAQVVRFQRCLNRLRHDPGVTLSEIATQCGYYDQSHLVRAYRRFAGVVPVQHAGYYPADAPQDFSPNVVQFVQDGGGT
jgi:AraC-like DNA-binding protein